MAGLIKHGRDTHDTRHFACTLCGKAFGNNADLCSTLKQNTLNFVMSAIELQMKYWWTTLGRPTREQECVLKSGLLQMNRLKNTLPDSYLKIYREGRRRRKRKRGTMSRMTMTRMMMKCITHPRTSTMKAKIIPSSGLQGRNSGMQMRKVTHK